MTRLCVSLAFVLPLLLTTPGLGQAPDPKEQFEQILQRLQTDPGGTTDQEAGEVLVHARKYGRSYAVNLAMKGFLSHHFQPQQEVVRRSADLARQVGDHRTAVTRYRKYLAVAPDNAVASEAAGHLYTVLVDQLQATDDAYATIASHMAKFRKHDLAKRFDYWFLEHAKKRNDFGRMADFLAVVLAERIPLEKERLYYWEHLDWVMSRVTWCQREHFAALQGLKKCVPLVRNDPHRARRYAFYVAVLQHYATATGQEERRQNDQYKQVLASARANFDGRPTVENALDIMATLMVGTGAHSHYLGSSRLRDQQPLAFEFFAYMFGKVDGHQKRLLLKSPMWTYFVRANTEQLVILGERYPQFFQKASYSDFIQWPYQNQPKEFYTRQAKFLAGVGSQRAGVINSLATSDDLQKVVDHWLRNETWHTGLTSAYDAYVNTIWQSYSRFERTEPLPADTHYLAWQKLGEGVSKTPAAVFDRSMVRSQLEYAFDHLDKAQFAGRVTALAWLPTTDAQRAYLYDNLYDKFQKWTTEVRAAAKAKEEQVPQAVLNQFVAIDRAIQTERRRTTPDLGKAPSTAARLTAQVHMAAETGNWAQYASLGTQLYAQVKNYRAGKIPYGRALVFYLLDKRGDAATFDMRLAILKDFLTRFVPGGDNGEIARVVNRLAYGGTSWAWNGSPAGAKPHLQKLNSVIADALMTVLNRNQFDNELFRWFEFTRRGSGWTQYDWRLDVGEKVVQSNVFHRYMYYPGADSYKGMPYRSATCATMYLIKYRFPALLEKYPVERYFDDMFVAEAKRTKVPDPAYFTFGGLDEERKIVNSAAELIAANAIAPVAYGYSVVAHVMGQDSYQYSIAIPHGAYTYPTAAMPASLTKTAYNYNLPPAAFWSWQQRALSADQPQRDAMLKAIEGRWGTTRFDQYAMGLGYFRTEPVVDTAEGREQWFKRTSDYIAKLKTLPRRLPPATMSALTEIRKTDLSSAELDVLKSVFPGAMPDRWPNTYQHEMLFALQDGLINHGRVRELQDLAPHLWRIARDADSPSWKMKTKLVEFTRRITEGEIALGPVDPNNPTNRDELGRNELGLVLASTGLDMLRTFLPVNERIELSALRNINLSRTGGAIPVKESDPRYPIFSSQNAWLTGRVQAAWELYLKNTDLIEDTIRDLDPQYSMWLIERNLESSRFEAATELAQHMLVWFGTVEGGFDPEVRARLQYVYAQISLAQKEYPRARAQFSRIVAASEYDGTRAQAEAELAVADVDRLQGRYDSALEIVSPITERDDPVIQAEAWLMMARVQFDQEEFDGSRDSLTNVFARNSEHEEGRILEGRVNLAMKKIEEVVEIEIGSVTLQRIIVPGKPLKVSLEDKNLAIVGRATDIEIRAWTGSGDEEFFSLLPFGDSRTRFRGQIDTEMADSQEGDKKLQLLGRDEVFYDFSERFKKAHKINFDQPPSLIVATDGALYGSSGTIRTPEELEAEALEALILSRLGEYGGGTTTQAVIPLAARRSDNQVKPGNKVNLRVVDPDRSSSAEIDELPVRVKAASGDRIEKFVLTETGPYTGVFEASVRTQSSQAIAFSSDSLEGRDPNYCISPKEYPAWAAQADGIRPKYFGVDLNDNVSLGTLTVSAGEIGQLLKDFAVEVSFNGKDWTTVGTWPKPFQPWDGGRTMRVVAVPRFKDIELPETIGPVLNYLNKDRITDGKQIIKIDIDSLVGSMNDAEVQRLLTPTLRVTTDKAVQDGECYILHYRGAFHMKHRRVRTVSLVSETPGEEVAYFLNIDATSPQTAGSGTTFKGSLAKGVHTIDVHVVARKGTQPKFHLTWDTLEEPFVEQIPNEATSIVRNPQIRDAIYVPPAEVTADEDGTEFTIKFDRRRRGRLVRLSINDYELSAPAINKVTLTDRDDNQVLPTQDDFRDLWQNNELEILSGDTVVVTYTDPSVVTRGNDVHEVSLTATYTNGGISAAFGKVNVNAAGVSNISFVPMRRFRPIQPGEFEDEETEVEPIFVHINDADLDVSEKLDTVTLSARATSSKTPIELTAVETAPHSGIFIGRLFPIAGESLRPLSADGAEPAESDEPFELAQNHLLVELDDEVQISYVDRENISPGVPWVRSTAVEQVWYRDPELRVFDVTATDLSEEQIATLLEAEELPAVNHEDLSDEMVVPQFTLSSVRPEDPDVEHGTAVIGGPVPIEILFPYVALSPESTVEIFVQTKRGREAKAKLPAQPRSENDPPPPPFDINIRGTIKLAARPSTAGSGPVPPGYHMLKVVADPFAFEPLEDGRFGFHIPVKLDDLPPKSYAIPSPVDEFDPPPSYVSISGDDELFIGFKYEDEDGNEQWMTRSISLTSDALFDVMDRKYQAPVVGLYVGQNAYFRVVAPGRDLTDEKDIVRVTATTTSGVTKTFELLETYSHSGIFKGLVNLVYNRESVATASVSTTEAEEGAEADDSGSDETTETTTPDSAAAILDATDSIALPVQYGDQVNFSYTEPGSERTISHDLQVFKGADGFVLPFTRRFNDEEIAVQTQITIAEAYFELAKRHRELGQQDIARKEIEQGKKLLEEAIRDYPQTKAKVQADYLLANLSLEFAKDTEDGEQARKLYMEAVNRFSTIVSAWPDSTYAAKSQYKKAQALEKMGDIDRACEEYVKLSYRYPDHELIADTIASLGQYFHTKGMQMRKAASESEDPVEGEKILIQSSDMFKTAAEVFSRLAPRFPDHNLAQLTLVRSAQCYMRAELFEDAVKTFEAIIDNKDADKDLRAEAMYWCADSHMRKEKPDMIAAYRVFKPLTWEYPESKWAKYARGRLASDKGLATIDAEGGEAP